MYVLSKNKSLRELSEILGFENVQIDTKIERIILSYINYINRVVWQKES